MLEPSSELRMLHETDVEPIIGEVGADEAKELASKRKYRNDREYGKH
jgi:hypothetical protein